MRHLRAILALPFLVTVVVPAALVWWRWSGASERSAALVVGVACVALGLGIAAWTITLFATRGHGTLAPWDPPQQLVLVGPYRHLRNPMIVAIIAVLAGEALVFWSLPLAIWCGAFALSNALYIPFREEPALLERFGAEYACYARNVPAFIPRRSAWDGHDDGTPRRNVDDLPLAHLPANQSRGVLLVCTVSTLALFAFLGTLLWTTLGNGPGPLWLLVFGAMTWALLDLRDARFDVLRPAPPDLLFGRLHDDGRTFELRDAPDGQPAGGWRFVRREKGTFVLLRPRIASRALVKRHRPDSVPFRMATLYEPRGKPDTDGWVRYPVSAIFNEPPGAWEQVRRKRRK